MQKTILRLALAALIIGVLLGGCRINLRNTPEAGPAMVTLAPAQASTNTRIAESPTPESATPTPAVQIQAAVSSTANPAEPTLVSLGGEVLAAENVDRAQAEALLLPGYLSRIYWPDNAHMLASIEDGWHLISIDPLELGVETGLDVPGMVLDIAPDGSGLIYQGGDGGVLLWERMTGESKVIPFGGAAYFGVYSQDGQTIALGAVDSWKVTLFDARSLEAVKSLSGFETAAPVYSALPGPGRKLLAWYARGTLQFQDVGSGVLGQPLGFQDFINSLAFSPDGKQMAVSTGGSLQVVDSDVSAPAAPVELVTGGAETPIYSVKFSPDGKLLAAGMGAVVSVWEVGSWQQVGQLTHDLGNARVLGFSPDGRAMVTTDESNQLRVWRVR